MGWGSKIKFVSENISMDARGSYVFSVDTDMCKVLILRLFTWLNINIYVKL